MDDFTEMCRILRYDAQIVQKNTKWNLYTWIPAIEWEMSTIFYELYQPSAQTYFGDW